MSEDQTPPAAPSSPTLTAAEHTEAGGAPSSGQRRFGTFAGVFTPSVLTILGVIMYLRVGWVTGQAGLLGAILIILLAHLITIATGLSVSSIATNREVGAGGAYNIISRSLGAPAGAAIGIPLFLAQALSVAFYIVGFTESVQVFLGGLGVQLSIAAGKAISSVLLVLLCAMSARSAALAIKAQYVVMAAIGLSLLAIFSGSSSAPPTELQWTGAGTESFSVVFAVFFPAVTGIMAGVGMSGDLKNPRRSLPIGTMSAIGVGLVVYLALPVWLAMNVSSEELVNDNYILWQLSSVPALIFLGVWGATISSAIGSILTAPRTLQALAGDGLVPRVLGRMDRAGNEPIVGLAITFVLAEAGILLGDLNFIAPILTMFFLATYGLTNLACGLERWASSPSFRPAYRLPAVISLVGALACFYVMSIISLPAMLAAMSISAFIFLLIERRDLGTTFGDARHGIWSALVRSALLRLRSASFHPENWRPNLIVLGGNPIKRPWLLHFGSAIVQDRGIVSYFHLLTGAVRDRAADRRRLIEEMESELAERLPGVFYRVDIVAELYQGVVSVTQSYGLGNVEANAVMLGWPSQEENFQGYADMLRDLRELDRSLFLVAYDNTRKVGNRSRIDIWWGGFPGNGSLMLLLAYLLTASEKWRGAQVNVMTVVENELQREACLDSLAGVLEAARLQAQARVLLRGERDVRDIMKSESENADLAILGIGLPDPDDNIERYFARINRMLEALPTTIIVHSARTFDGEPVLFSQAEESS
ncbi:MAG: Na-K-Cl cotransporter [Rickettsiales bacterium]|nr:Na-K-Cl cotransporter [Rickettsiales bacterium]